MDWRVVPSDCGRRAREGAWSTQEFPGLWSQDSPACRGGRGTQGEHPSHSITKDLPGTFGKAQSHVWGGVLGCVQSLTLSELLVCEGGHPRSFLPSLLFHLFVLLPSLFHRTHISSMCHTSNKIQTHCSHSFKTSVKRSQRHSSQLQCGPF